MAEDWLADVRKYHSGADEGVVRKIVNYLGIALRNRDSSLVSFSDPAEVGRVRERFLRKKLGLTDTDATLNAGLDAVKQMMSGDRTRNRVTVYYLLADYFGKQDLFGGAASAPGGFSFGAVGPDQLVNQIIHGLIGVTFRGNLVLSATAELVVQVFKFGRRHFILLGG